MPANVALSPDGSTLAWTLRAHDGSTLHLAPVATPTDDKLIAIPNATSCGYSSPIWSPDGATLAFLGACAPESRDPTVPASRRSYATGLRPPASVKQTTHVTGDIDQPALVP